MLCYRDRSYCIRTHHCSNEQCHRYLTSKDRDRAIELRLSIAWMDYYEEKDCKQYEKEKL